MRPSFETPRKSAAPQDDGAGKLTGKQSSSRGGKIGREKLEGAYTLDADCTGTMEFGTVPNHGGQTHWDLYVTEDHKRGTSSAWMKAQWRRGVSRDSD
jgi:hypothetical protein